VSGLADRRGVLRGARHAWSEGGLPLLSSRALRRGAEALYHARDAAAAFGAARAVRRAPRSTLDEALEFAANFEYAGITIRPMQIPSELRSLLELVAKTPPRAVVEIGTARGGTLFLFAAVAQTDAVLVSIDAASTEGLFGARRTYRRRARLYCALGRRDQRVVFIAADSHRADTLRDVQAALGGRPVDLLFVDGDHSRAGVEADFRMYSPLVREGGLVAFHDIVPGPDEHVGGVPEFWQHVRDSDSLELVDDWGQGGCGIGVLRL
jgi:predicted O-methyltransferase YrrM